MTVNSERNEKVAALVNQGHTFNEVAKTFHITKGAVAGIVYRAKQPFPDRSPLQWTKSDDKVFQKLMKWNWDIPAISQAFGVSQDAVRRKIKYDKKRKPI